MNKYREGDRESESESEREGGVTYSLLIWYNIYKFVSPGETHLPHIRVL